MEQQLFRRESIDHISSPEQLTDYLRVTNPRIWVILAAVILLLAGIFAWSMIGTLETTTGARVIVQDYKALVACDNAETLTEGMALRIAGQDYAITATQTDSYGRSIGVAEVSLPNGTYDGTVVTETVHPIDFLLESR